MLHIRQFVKGTDEQVWVKVLNATYKEYGASWMGVITVEEMLEEEKRPNFDFEGRFIAELNGKPVGIVHAHVDKLSKEKKVLTDEEKKMIERCRVDPGSWFTQTEVGFYAVLTEGKVTVPKEVIEELKLTEDQLVRVIIDHA